MGTDYDPDSHEPVRTELLSPVYRQDLGTALLASITAQPPIPLPRALAGAIAGTRARHEHAEDTDRDHTRWPRTKTSDDATIVYWQLD